MASTDQTRGAEPVTWAQAYGINTHQAQVALTLNPSRPSGGGSEEHHSRESVSPGANGYPADLAHSDGGSGWVPVGHPRPRRWGGGPSFKFRSSDPKAGVRWVRPAGLPVKGIARPDAPPDLASGDTGVPQGSRRAEGGVDFPQDPAWAAAVYHLSGS